MNGATLLTAEDVAAIAAAYDAAEAARADKRAARLLREHPTAGGPRTHTRSLYDQRARGCARCDAELIAERAARQAVLHAEHDSMAAYVAATGAPTVRHSSYEAPGYDATLWPDSARTAAGSHVTHRTDREYPPLAGGADWQRDYKAEPTVTERYTVACSWECPDRPRNY